MRDSHLFLLANLAALGLSLPTHVLLAKDATAQSDTLEEVVVTAERRAENPQTMPVSVIALSGKDLKESGVSNIADLQSIVPSLSYVDAGNVKFINIRGVGLNEGAPNQTDGVANYLDGAYIAREFTTDDSYFDLDNVEVLRGPQGTYVGQNSTGGAIFINTKKPSLNGIDGYVEQTFGTYNYRHTEAAANVPVSSTLALRAAVLAESRDSFTANFGPYGSGSQTPVTNHPGNLNRFVGRIQLLYQPTDSLAFHLLYQNSNRRNDGIPYQPINAQTLANPYAAAYDFPEAYNNQYQRTTGTMDWQTSHDFKVHLVSSYQTMNQLTQWDSDATSPYVSPGTVQGGTIIPLHDWYSTHEVDLISTSDSKLQWTVGATTLNYHQPFTDQIINYNSARSPALTPDFSSGLFLNFHSLRKNYAAFGEVSYDINPAWQVKLGARYNHDTVGLQAGSYLIPFGGPTGPIKVPAGPNIPSFTAGTGRVVVNFKPAQNQLVYLNVSRGYKPGGWTPDIGGPPTPNNVYSAEYVLNYELGWKATAFDGHLRTAADVFHMDYQGFQATIATDPRNPTTSVTKNVSGTKIQGVEAELDAAANGFHATLGFTYLDAKFGNLLIFEPANEFGPGSPATPTQINLNGRTIDYAPKLSGNLGLAYEFALKGGATLTPRVQWSYQGGQWTSFFNAPQQYLPAYALGSARLTYVPSKTWQVEGYVTNIADRVYLTESTGNTPALQVGQFGAPRQYGVTVHYSF